MRQKVFQRIVTQTTNVCIEIVKTDIYLVMDNECAGFHDGPFILSYCFRTRRLEIKTTYIPNLQEIGRGSQFINDSNTLVVGFKQLFRQMLFKCST